MALHFLKDEINLQKLEIPKGISVDITIDDLSDYEHQTREKELDPLYEQGIEDLAADIKKNGQINPITVIRVINRKDGTSKHIAVAGSRRIDAIKKLNLSKISANIFTLYSDDPELEKKKFLITDSENEKRQNLAPIENCKAIKYMNEVINMDIEQIAAHRNISKDMVYRYIQIASDEKEINKVLSNYNKNIHDIKSLSQLRKISTLIRNGDKEKLLAYCTFVFAEESDEEKENIAKNIPNEIIPERSKLNPDPIIKTKGNFQVTMRDPYKIVINGKKAVSPDYINPIKDVIKELLKYDNKGDFTQYLSDSSILTKEIKGLLKTLYEEFESGRRITPKR